MPGGVEGSGDSAPAGLRGDRADVQGGDTGRPRRRSRLERHLGRAQKVRLPRRARRPEDRDEQSKRVNVMAKETDEGDLRDSALYFIERDEETGAVTVDLIRERFTAHNARELRVLAEIFSGLSQRMSQFLQPCSGEDASDLDCEAIEITDMRPLWDSICGRRKRGKRNCALCR